MRKEKALKCSATNCCSNGPNEGSIIFFPFPADDRKRCRQWVTNTKCQKLRKKGSKSLLSCHLCSRHFGDDQFTNDQKTALTTSAVPTIFDAAMNVDATAGQSQPFQNQIDNSGESVGNEEEQPENDKAPQSPQSGAAGKGVDDDASSPCFSQNNKKGRPSQKSMYKSGNTHCQWCSAINCSNNRIKRPDLSFFRFPLDPERCKKWIMNSQRFDLKDKTSKKLHSGSYIICSEHFEDRCMIDKGSRKGRLRLYKWAVPTIFNFSVQKGQRKGRKPAPTFPSAPSHSQVGNADRFKRVQSSIGSDAMSGPDRKRTRSSLKRNPEAVKSEPVDNGTKSNPKMKTIKELKRENLYLSDQLYHLTQSRVQTMRWLEELESQMDMVKEHSRIDIEVLRLALDSSKHQDAEQEFERLKSVINLLKDEEEDEEQQSGRDDTVSCESSE